MRAAPAILAVSFGLLVGLGGATFDYAEGLSYMSSDPKACVDCHLPTTFPEKYIAKARNGWFHSRAFTLQDFPEPIAITPPNAALLQENCERCHGALVLETAAHSGAPECVTCHDDVGHGETVGLGGPLRGDPMKELE